MSSTRTHVLSTSQSGVVEPGLASAADSPEALMDAFLDGDARAFEQLFRQIAPRVTSVLTHMCNDARLAEDLTQTVFLKLYNARSAYQRGMLVMPWVFAIARNTFLDHRRHVKRRPESLSSDGVLPDLEDRRAPEQGAQRAFEEMLQKLPGDQREALLLLKVHGLSLAEAAALCGTSSASIKMRAHRAYRSLRAALTERTRR